MVRGPAWLCDTVIISSAPLNLPTSLINETRNPIKTSRLSTIAALKTSEWRRGGGDGLRGNRSTSRTVPFILPFPHSPICSHRDKQACPPVWPLVMSARSPPPPNEIQARGTVPMKQRDHRDEPAIPDAGYLPLLMYQVSCSAAARPCRLEAPRIRIASKGFLSRLQTAYRPQSGRGGHEDHPSPPCLYSPCTCQACQHRHQQRRVVTGEAAA